MNLDNPSERPTYVFVTNTGELGEYGNRLEFHIGASTNVRHALGYIEYVGPSAYDKNKMAMIVKIHWIYRTDDVGHTNFSRGSLRPVSFSHFSFKYSGRQVTFI